MRQSIGFVVLILALSVTDFRGEAPPLIRKRVSEVQLTLVATDRNDRPLSHLSPGDITVLEDGHRIPHFELRPGADLPLRVGIVLDLSDSTRKSWATLRGVLIESLERTLRPNDELLIVAFNTRIEVERTIADLAELESAVEVSTTGGLTALYDTLYHACGSSVLVGDHSPHRSALILFSDGEDDVSIHGLNEAIAKAELNGISVYTVATHHPKVHTRGDDVLHDLAESTGGRDFVVEDARELRDRLAVIQEELRSSYLLS